MKQGINFNDRFPRFIYFTGVDGSGKSTYADLLARSLDQQGLKTRRVWLRFNYILTKPVLLYCRLTGLTRRPVRGGRKISVHDFHRSPFIGKLVQYLHFADTCLMSFVKIYLPLRFTKDVIICDRFVYDVLADFMVENRYFILPEKAIARWLIRLIPEKSKILFFKAEKDEIIRRKPEVLDEDEDYDLKYTVYQELERRFDFKIIENSASIQNVFKEVRMQVEGKNETQKASQEIRLESEKPNAL